MTRLFEIVQARPDHEHRPRQVDLQRVIPRADVALVAEHAGRRHPGGVDEDVDRPRRPPELFHAVPTESASRTSTGISPLLSNTATSNPRVRSNAMVARPIPLAPPVTTARRFMRGRGRVGLQSCRLGPPAVRAPSEEYKDRVLLQADPGLPTLPMPSEGYGGFSKVQLRNEGDGQCLRCQRRNHVLDRSVPGAPRPGAVGCGDPGRHRR